MTSLRLLSICFGLALMLLSLELFAVEKHSTVQQNHQPTSDSPMTRLLVSFRKAGPPRASDMPGKWVLIRNVSTEKFLTGRQGQDHVLFNINGIRREGQPGNPLEWTLMFSVTKDRHLQVTSHTVWVPTGDISSVDLSSEGDLIFEIDYGGDSKWVYRCRAVSARHLVCLLRNHEDGHGVEFLKTAN